ncbi:transforming growth factor beta regulator 1, partial [Podila humilis]
LLSEFQHKAGLGPTSDSDTTLDDLSDSDDDSDDDHSRTQDRVESRNNPSNKHSTQDRARKVISSQDQNQSCSTSTGDASQHTTIPYSNTSSSYTNIAPSPTPTSAPYSISRATSIHRPDAPQEVPHAPKQTRKATKRADRGRPRPVVPLKTNPDGSLNYPIVVGKGTNEVIIENMVGFRSKKQYTSLSDTSKKTYFISEILDGGDAPIFQISLEDMPDKVFRHSSSSGAWELALRSLMDLGFNAKTHASGPDMYGLTNLGVIKYIQEMPNAHRCRRYMPLKWIIDDEHVDGIPLSELQAQQSAGESSQSAVVAAGSKSPLKKKKINNTIYASNHSSAQKDYEASRGSSVEYTHATKPYTPRKYTKRKQQQQQQQQTTPTPSPVQAIGPRSSSSFSTPMDPVSIAAAGSMEGVQVTKWPLSPPTSSPSSTITPLTHLILGAPVHLEEPSRQDKDSKDSHHYNYRTLEP